MRKLFTFLCAAMMLPAAAQWPADDNNLLPVAPMTPDTLEHYYPLMIRKADGTTLVALMKRSASKPTRTPDRKGRSRPTICTSRSWTKTATRYGLHRVS